MKCTRHSAHAHDISGFLRGNSDANRHCFMIRLVHAQVRKYKIPKYELIFVSCNEAELTFLELLENFLDCPPPLVCVCAEFSLWDEMTHVIIVFLFNMVL